MPTTGYKGGWNRDVRGVAIAARRGMYGRGMHVLPGTGEETPENTFARLAGPALAHAIENGVEQYRRNKAQSAQLAVAQDRQRRLDAQANQKQQESQATLAAMTPEMREAARAHKYFGVPYPQQAKGGGALNLDPQTQAAFDSLPPDQQQQALLHRARLAPPTTQPRAGAQTPEDKQLANLGKLIQFHQTGLSHAQSAGDLEAADMHTAALKAIGPTYEQQLKQRAGLVPPAQPSHAQNLANPQSHPPTRAGGSASEQALAQQQQAQSMFGGTDEEATGMQAGAGTLSPEIKRQLLQATGVHPDRMAKLPPMPLSVRNAITSQVSGQESDPIKVRAAQYRMAVERGFNPTLPPVPDPVQVQVPPALAQPQQQPQTPVQQPPPVQQQQEPQSPPAGQPVTRDSYPFDE